jgi:hypothetical protein
MIFITVFPPEPQVAAEHAVGQAVTVHGEHLLVVPVLTRQ